MGLVLKFYNNICIIITLDLCIWGMYLLQDLDSTQNIHPGIKVGDQLYVKHTFPKLSGAQGASKENNYGMLYHEPTTEAEIEMNELWLAKRQQEVCSHFFDLILSTLLLEVFLFQFIFRLDIRN